MAGFSVYEGIRYTEMDHSIPLQICSLVFAASFVCGFFQLNRWYLSQVFLLGENHPKMQPKCSAPSKPTVNQPRRSQEKFLTVQEKAELMELFFCQKKLSQ